MFLIVPLGLLHIDFSPNSFTLVSSANNYIKRLISAEITIKKVVNKPREHPVEMSYHIISLIDQNISNTVLVCKSAFLVPIT